MAVLYIYESPNANLEVYDRLSTELIAQGTPAGGLLHVSGNRDGGGLVVVEVWESEESHDRFDKIRTERIAVAGAPPRPAPRKLPVRKMVTAQTTTAV
jgi:hypothetical protein